MRWTGWAAAFVIVGGMWAFYRLLTTDIDHTPRTWQDEPVTDLLEFRNVRRSPARPYDWEQDA